MTKISRFFLENYKFTTVLTLFFIFFGYRGLSSLSSESFPTVNMGQVIIVTAYNGATAEDIEAKITKPIEDEVRSITGIKEVKSVSQPGLSQIISVVDVDNYPVEEVIADLQRAVDRVPDLPTDLLQPPEFIEVKTEEMPVVEIAIVGENTDRIRDRVALELKEDVEDIKSISDINIIGFRERQFKIIIDNEKLKKNYVGLNEVTSALSSQNIIIPGGSLESNGNQQLIKIDEKTRSVEEIENIVVRSNFSGSRVSLNDLGQVIDSEEEPTELVRHFGQPATFLIVSQKGGTDTIDLATAVKEKLARFSKKYQGQLEFNVYNDEGVRVQNRIDVLKSNGLAGLALVFIFLLLFLPGRAGFMTSLSLPLAVLTTFGYIQASGMSLNTITILAMVISIGMLVDNAVVIAENFVRLRSEGKPDKEAILTSIQTLWLPITATAMTTIAAFLPMLVTKGILGQFIKGIPLVITASLVISLFECFILLPIRLVRKKQKESKTHSNTEPKKDWFIKWVAPGFKALVRKLVRFRYLTAVFFVGLISFSIFMMTSANKFVLFPADQTEIYLVRVEMPRGTVIEKTDESLAEVAQLVKEKLGDSVKHVTSTAGISEQDPADPKSMRGDNVGLLKVFMTEDGKNNLITNDVLKRLRTIVYEPAENLVYEAMINGPPVGAPVTAILRSNDSKQLKEASEKLASQLKGVDGVFDVKVDDVFGPNELTIKIDPVKAKRLGLSAEQVGQTVRVAMAGLPVTSVNINNREVDYFVRLKSDNRKNIADLKNLKVMNQSGDLIPLTRFAVIQSADGASFIKRFDYKQAKTVTANINDDVITSMVANKEVEKFFDAMKSDYKEVTLKFGGEAERTQESFESLMQALILSLIGIFALLVFLFKSYIKPLIILTTIPLGLFGVAVAFFVHQRPISFLALIGVVGLGGIIVNSGIVLISFVETLIKENPERPLIDALVDATGLRLRAVIVTSLTTVSGLLPTAYGIGGSDEFIIPMTLAMAWGLVSGTLLALLWVPAAYAITEDFASLVSNTTCKVKSIFRRGHDV